jgi:hypothetical protein
MPRAVGAERLFPWTAADSHDINEKILRILEKSQDPSTAIPYGTAYGPYNGTESDVVTDRDGANKLEGTRWVMVVTFSSRIKAFEQFRISRPRPTRSLTQAVTDRVAGWQQAHGLSDCAADWARKTESRRHQPSKNRKSPEQLRWPAVLQHVRQRLP